MPHLNFEFKAKAKNLDELENKLLALRPHFVGEDHQVDTYFNTLKGRLKLRQGNIENSLIYYERENIDGAKQSNVILCKLLPNEKLKELLTTLHGIKAIVDKSRKIYLIENVKFHFDTVKDLGRFIEVEAIDENDPSEPQKLERQCDYYSAYLGIDPADYVVYSYGDLILPTSKQLLS